MSGEKILYASFSDHFKEFKKLLIQILLVLFIASALCTLFYQPLLSLLTWPLPPNSFHMTEGFQEEMYQTVRVVNRESQLKRLTLPPHALTPSFQSEQVRQVGINQYEMPPDASLIYQKKIQSSLMLFGPLEGMFVLLKMAWWGGVSLSSPFWLFLLMRFIFPALKQREKRLISPFLLLSFSFILFGMGFALIFTLPLANKMLALFNQSMGNNAWSLNHYVDYTLFFLFANGLLFELCALGIFGVTMGIFNAENLAAKRKIAIAMAFILGALLTPPDIFSQLLLAFPLIGIYELLILYAKLRGKMASKE